jgi:hypothetical protein
MNASFVCHTADSSLTIEVSGDGSTWTTYTTVPLMRDFQYHYETKLTKQYIRFKNTVQSEALLRLREV